MKKGHKLSQKHKNSISEAMKGKKRKPFSDETIEKMRGRIGWNKGKKTSEETRRKLSEVHKARKEKNNFWKGGVTQIQLQIRHCFEYRQWRSDIFTRDDYTCQYCGDRGGELNADHYPKMFSTIFHENKIKSLEDGLKCEEFWNINNGRTLCRECHIKVTKQQII